MRTWLSERFDVRVTLVYALVALLWIIFSDQLLNFVNAEDDTRLVAMSTFKGVAFVVVTSLALFGVLNYEFRKRNRVEHILDEDIEERTKTLETLRQWEQRFATIFHGSSVPTGISRNDDGKIVDANDAFVELFGYTREELIGHTAIEVGLWVHPEKRAELLRVIEDGGSVRDVEVEGRRKDGEVLHLLDSSQKMELGNEAHIVCMLYDISEHRKLEAQIRYQALLLENVSDAVISTDGDFTIRSWNPSAEAIYGWTAEEVIGKPVQDVIQGVYVETTEAEALHMLMDTGGWRGVSIHRRKDGSRVHILASTSYVNDSAGNRLGVVSVNRDISELMKAQQELQAAELLRLELEQQADLLKLKERFISVVSHEFRTPLSVIVSSSELINNYYDRMPKERQLKHLEVILTQAQFMTHLLDDVLTINKARAGKLDFNPTLLNLTSFCQETMERIEAVDNGKHTLVMTHEGDMSAVRMDVKMLQHILVNLLSNAVKYSPQGGNVRLELKREPDAVMLRVSDEGIGIPEESLQYLFEPFHRAKNIGEIGGTGLGLAIVKESVDRHGGTITCETALHVGTTFTVRLPVESDG